MRVLVTGHLGYVGTVLTPRLSAAGYAVAGWDSDLFADCTFGVMPPPIPAHRADIRDITAADLVGYDAVIHLAALSNDPLGDLDPAQTRAINEQATVQLAQAARAAGVTRFLLASSCSVYGAAGEDWLYEGSTCAPVTAYGWSKLRAERQVAALASANFCPTFLRAATVYGLSPRLRFDLVVNNLVAWAVATGEVLLKSDGTAWRPLLHIEDFAQAFVTLLAAPRNLIHNQVFNIGDTAANWRIRDLAALITTTLPGVRVEMVPGAVADTRNYRVNCDKLARTFPTAQPRGDLVDGVQALASAFAAAQITPAEFEGPRYQRVGHLRHLRAAGRLTAALRWVA